MKTTLTALLMLMAATAACSDEGPTRGLNCDETGHCDKPRGTVKEQCTNSRVNAMDENRPHFTDKGVRWSCRDVNGVTAGTNTRDDRGQEYCEYFGMLHTKGIPSVILDSKNSPVFCDATTKCIKGSCDESIFSCVTSTTVNTSTAADILGKNKSPTANTVTALDPRLSKGQLEWLSQNPAQKVGECLFTSWHQDITTLPTSTETVGGWRLNAKLSNSSIPLFRMAGQFNSNGAAQTLLKDCLAPGDASIKDGFMRGCTECGGVDCVPWRKSDPSVCTMAMRVAECGCSIDIKDAAGKARKLDLSKDKDLALAQELFVPRTRRGFTLGTWDGIGQLPSGCRYVKTGDSTSVKVNGASVTDANADQTIVACDLLGSHINSAAKDPKEACRTTYGDEVVVHVRAPDAALATLSCDTAKKGCETAPWDFENL